MLKDSIPNNSPNFASKWVESRLRRILDIAFALVILAITAPIMILVAAAVWMTSPGPAIFRQKRVGLHNSLFTVYKFRSMRACSESGPAVTSGDDGRITSVGRFIRHHKIDELPQLWNVLRGDMAIVGPRPFLPEHAPMNTHVTPGLTGVGSLMCFDQEQILRMVHAANVASVHHTVLLPMRHKIDLTYLKTASLSSDLRVILETIITIAFGLYSILKRDDKKYRAATVRQAAMQYDSSSSLISLVRSTQTSHDHISLSSPAEPDNYPENVADLLTNSKSHHILTT